MLRRCIILLRQDIGTHYENATSAFRGVRDAGRQVTCIAPRGLLIPAAQHVLRYDSRAARSLQPSADDDVVMQLLRQECAKGDVDGIFPLAEEDVIPAGQGREEFGIAGANREVAELFRSKDAMIGRASSLGWPVQRWGKPSTLASLRAFAHEVGFPFVVKAVDGFAGRGVHQVGDEAQLHALWGQISDSWQLYRAESFNHSPTFHVDLVVAQGRVRFAAACRYLEPLLARGRLGSALLSNTEAGPLLDACSSIVAGFGLETGCVHAEFFWRPNEAPVLIEVASRPIGAFGVQLYECAFGVNIVYEWVRCSFEPDRIPAVEIKEHAAAEYLVAPAAGEVVSVSGIERIRGAAGVSRVEVLRVAGERVGQDQHLFDRAVAYVIAASNSEATVYEALQEARRAFSVRVQEGRKPGAMHAPST